MGAHLYRRVMAVMAFSALFMASHYALAEQRSSPDLPSLDSYHEPYPHDVYIYHRGTIIDENELEQMRGGFRIGGVELSFGATLKTLLEGGNIRLETILTFGRHGAEIVSQSFENMTGLEVDQIGGDGVAITEVTPSHINLSGLADFSGIAINDTHGFTAALHRITRNAIISSVISDSYGGSIDNRINIDIHVGNMSEIRAARQRDNIIRSIQGF